MHYVTQGRPKKGWPKKARSASLRLEPAEKNFRASLEPKARSSQARALTPRPLIAIKTDGPTKMLIILGVASILLMNSCALSIFLNKQSNNSQVSCNPQNRQLFGKFILMCWSNARKIIGLTDPFESSPTNHDQKLAFKLAVEKVVLKIYNHNNGASIYYKHWVPIPYIRIPNCGERSITNLLDSECTPPVLAISI